MKTDKIQRSRIAVKDLKARKDVKGGTQSHLTSSGSQVSSNSSSKTSSGGSKSSVCILAP
jgi:hypothetical protein